MNHHGRNNRGWSSPARRWLGAMTHLVGLMALTSGCVFVAPVPTAYHPAGSRRNLTEETTGRFARGTTTVDDVALALGEPDEATANPARLTYRWERVNMHLSWGWMIAFGGVGGGQAWNKTYSHRHSVSFEFDQAGRLQGVQAINERDQSIESTEL